MEGSQSGKQTYNIAMCCDFFYPRIGGVEMHIFQLALKLMELGHKVIVITHQYGNRQGVRYVTNGLKVYYCPFKDMVDAVIFPSQIGILPLFRQILIRENIQIVHCHAATSTLSQEAIIHSRTMGMKTVFTDHSLFGFSDTASIHINKLSKFYFSDLDHAISVSHTSKENLTLRAYMNPKKISVIPNAVDSGRFKPDPSKKNPKGKINIVFMARLAYRKGADLLIDIIPVICKEFKDVHFIIGGDGPKRVILEKMIKKHQLKDRVELLGAVQHKDVRDILVRGDLFLNTSLTEAFCIAIVEAASSGLLVVSTNVGGIREVLPPHMIYLSEPNPKSMVANIREAIPNIKKSQPEKFHQEIKNIYNWMNVAKSTEKIYDKIMKYPQLTIMQRFKRYLSCGPLAGIILLTIIVFEIIFHWILNIVQPIEDIDEAIDFPFQDYMQDKESFGDHSHNLFSSSEKQQQKINNKNIQQNSKQNKKNKKNI